MDVRGRHRREEQSGESLMSVIGRGGALTLGLDWLRMRRRTTNRHHLRTFAIKTTFKIYGHQPHL